MHDRHYSPIEMIQVARCISNSEDQNLRVSSTIELVGTVAHEQHSRTLLWIRERLEAGEHLEDLLAG